MPEIEYELPDEDVLFDRHMREQYGDDWQAVGDALEALDDPDQCALIQDPWAPVEPHVAETLARFAPTVFDSTAKRLHEWVSKLIENEIEWEDPV